MQLSLNRIRASRSHAPSYCVAELPHLPPQGQHVLQELLEGHAQRLRLLAQERLVWKVWTVCVTTEGLGRDKLIHPASCMSSPPPPCATEWTGNAREPR